MIFDIVDFTIDAIAFGQNKPGKKRKPRLSISIGMVVHRRPGDIPIVLNGLLYRFPFGDFVATNVDNINGLITFRSAYHVLTLKKFILAITNGSIEGSLVAMMHSEGV